MSPTRMFPIPMVVRVTRLGSSARLQSKYNYFFVVTAMLTEFIVQERSSSQRKELFRNIQIRNRLDPKEAAKQMILDMKVRWSSTYAMLDRGYELKEASCSALC